VIFLLGAFTVGLVTDYFFYCHFRPISYPATTFLTLLNCGLLIKTFHCPILILKGLFFSQALIIAGYYDAKSHTIPNWIVILTAASGLIDFQPVRSAVGAFSVSVLFFIVSYITNEKGIGGGDVKLAAATGFVLGAAANTIGTLTGILLFLIVYLIAFRKGKRKSYAMAPWLGTGCFFAYVFIN
jgi:leader peptidase (prepilin peptidase)/N-methyltransferase